MPSETGIILRWFYREAFPPGNLEFDELLFGAVRLALGKSEIDTEAYLHRNCRRLWSELLKCLDWDATAGRFPIFEITNRENRRLRWLPSNIDSLDSTKKKQLGFRLGARPYITQIIDLFSDREYEALGCVICEFVGATNVFLTSQGNERGIDFLATIHIPGRCHVFSGPHKLFRVVGQAKKYESKVEFEEIQRLTDTLNEIKYQNPEMQRLIPAWFQSASGPIIGWVIAHNGVQSGGISYARNHGIMISDSIDLAEIAALSHQLDNLLPPRERADALRARVRARLHADSL